ncbi:MAG: hypothetical protein PHV05_01100 [Candidatus Riflebacteria bacterium]|nr:hypothetical protein [Candidatus Riflebacteria bacterium]
MNRFVTHVENKVREANSLMESGQTDKAVETLNDANRYIESVVNFDLEEQFSKARKENPSFNFNLQVNLAGGFDSAYWKRKYDLANSSLASSKSALSGLASMRTLDKQDQAWAYMKTVYESVKTVKDVVEGVTTQKYFDAFMSAKEGVDGFIKNYEEIEAAHLQKLKTELLEAEMNGLIRRANRAIRSVEPILSFMKANAEEGERFEMLMAKVGAIQEKVLSGAAQEMVFGDFRYTWNYGPFIDEIKSLCKEAEDLKMPASDFRNSYEAVKIRAKESWQLVQNNIRESNDERQKPQYLKWAESEWNDFEKCAEEASFELLSKTTMSENAAKSSNKADLFAGADNDEKKPDLQKQQKPSLFAGLDEEKEDSSEDMEGEGSEELSEKKPKINLFAGGDAESSRDVSVKTAKLVKLHEGGNYEGKKLGSVLSNGDGDNRSKSGGTYIGVDLKQVDDDDLIAVKVTSGQFRFVHVHLRNAMGIWYSIYNGTHTLFRVGDLVKDKRSGFTHINFSVNGQHDRFLPVQCAADIYLYKSDGVSAKIKNEFASQWRSGSAEIPNEFMNTRPDLWLGGKRPVVIAEIPSDSTRSTMQSTQNIENNDDKDKTGQNVVANADSEKPDDELRALVTEINSVVKKADADFNKKYWQENGSPQTAQQATNPKASTLKIMRDAMRIARNAKFPQNRVTLSYIVARKLIEYAGRVFVYVGKREFFVEAATMIHEAGGLIDKVKKDKVSISFMHSDHGEMWRTLGEKALVGDHSYNKNECYRLEVAAYERALNIYSENYKAKKALKK